MEQIREMLATTDKTTIRTYAQVGILANKDLHPKSKSLRNAPLFRNISGSPFSLTTNIIKHTPASLSAMSHLLTFDALPKALSPNE